MPIYEYRCSVCSHELEALQKFSDPPLTECPACRKAALVKRVSAAGFQLKGSGWYVTDFKGSSSKPAAKSNGGEDKSGDAKKETSEAATPSTKSAATDSTTT
jgi:putative FmdB family regulatory protein